MIKIMKASAGSGKTYSLARTYISLLLRNEDRYAYRHILAVTFTNKATDEMKSRILKELHIMATRPQESSYRKDFVPSVFPSIEKMQEKAKAVLSAILHDYSSFAVSTIDKFFQQTLKAFSREIGQFASYQVELDKNSLVAESVDRLLDSLTEDSGSLLSWLTDNVLEQIEQGARYSMDANLLKMALRLKSSQRQEALEQAGIDEEDACSKEKLVAVRNACREIVTSFNKQVKAAARAALNVLEGAGVNASDSNRGFMKALYVYDEASETDVIEAPKESFFVKALDPEQWFSKAKAAKLLPLVEYSLQDPLDDFCKLWGKDYAVYNTARILDGQVYGLGVAGELRRIFNDLMKEKNVLCIDDSNTILRDIIDGSDAPFVYERLGVRFDHFLLDEFQDTSKVQWENFSPLLHNSDAQGGENLIVGDVKQSIYRWRGSEWKLLDSVIPGEFPDHVVDPLDTNYRSLPGVVNFNNGFFQAAAAELDRMAGVDNGEGPIGNIYSDVRQKIAKNGTDEGSVELTFCQKDDELSEVLKSVRKAQGAGAEYCDMAILVRSNAVGEEIASYLISEGVPVITDDSLKINGAITVRRIVSLMSYVDNPENTVSGYLADTLDVALPESCSSLVDMAESLIRSLKQNVEDGFREGETLHVQSFMDCLQEYVMKEGNSLRGFLKHWEGIDPSIASPSSGNSVRVMTIHKSKGLDFPYVIIPFVENITLFKPDSLWCSPDLTGTGLEQVAEGVYDVLLSGNSEATLFADKYREEHFMQQVDNLNIIYVAMTRAALGMHMIGKMPSEKLQTAIVEGNPVAFSDFSQILYNYAVQQKLLRFEDEGVLTFSYGKTADFSALREKEDEGLKRFPIAASQEYPSIPLNHELEDGDVRERGRLKFSADSLDFFSEDGEAGISASNRIRGVVLHDILAKIVKVEDLSGAVRDAVGSGELSAAEAEQVMDLLQARINQAKSYGWFPDDFDSVLNETSLIDSDGQIYRPDRVVFQNDKVIIIDYKFGEHYKKYERQMKAYSDIWQRMGYPQVEAYLWYVQTGEIIQVHI